MSKFELTVERLRWEREDGVKRGNEWYWCRCKKHLRRGKGNQGAANVFTEAKKGVAERSMAERSARRTVYVPTLKPVAQVSGQKSGRVNGNISYAFRHNIQSTSRVYTYKE